MKPLPLFRNPCDFRAQIEMLGFETERTRHAATAGVENVELNPRCLAQGSDGSSLCAQGLLVAVSMIDATCVRRIQIKLTLSRIDLFGQPAFGKMYALG